jgi:hypothetical protein
MTSTLAMALASFLWWIVLVFFPAAWRRFMDWENAVSVWLGVPHGIVLWLKKHETGATLKVVVLVLTVVCTLCSIKASYLIK